MRRYFFVIIFAVCGMAIFLTNISGQNFSAKPPILKIFDVDELLQEFTYSLVDIFDEKMKFHGESTVDTEMTSSFKKDRTEFFIHIIIKPDNNNNDDSPAKSTKQKIKI